jgi:hypothetical protein
MRSKRFDERGAGDVRHRSLFLEERPPHERAAAALRVGAAIALVLHGLIHLLGALTYLGVAEFDGLPYRTVLFAGRWDVGESGAQLFGVGWLIAAVALIGVGLALALRQAWWRRLVLLAAPLSLVLCLLAWPDAPAGAAFDVAIILAVLLPRRDLFVADGHASESAR